MSEDFQYATLPTDEILAAATDLTQGQVTYVNNVSVNVGANEVILDLYFLGTDPSDTTKTSATRLQRVVLPLDVAKQTGSILLRLVEKWENAFGVRLPLEPSIESGQEE
jgi:hypothetical protein